MHRRMLRPLYFVAVLVTFSISLSAQTVVTQSFTNNTSLSVPGIGAANLYPSPINVTGMPAFLHGFVVEVDLFQTINLGQIDLLLEAPGGQRLILFSDMNSGNGPLAVFDLRLGTESELVAGSGNITDGAYLLPGNQGVTADTFPGLGPISQPSNPDPFALQDINPNGSWKLYVLDDTPGGSTSLSAGWSIIIRAGDVPACRRPGLPQLLQTADFNAQIRWDAGSGNTQWDVLVQQEADPEPGYNTAPTISKMSAHEQVVLDNLQAGTPYRVWVRANCGGQAVSRWRGPLAFTTAYNPCSNTVPVEICQLINAPTRPYYTHFLSDILQCWIFPFVPPADGDYWIHYPGANSFAYPYYRLADTCTESGWQQADKYEQGTNSSLRISNLQGGKTYWMAHLGLGNAPLPFYWSACPVYQLHLYDVEKYTDSIRLVLQNSMLPPDTLEFYLAPSPATPPDDATLPTATLLPGQSAVAFHGLQPATAYQYYYRTRCTPARASCWQGPLSAATIAVCSTPQLLKIDTVTAKQVVLTFTWTPDSSLMSWRATLCSATQKPWLNQYQAIQYANPLIHGDTATLTFNNVTPYFPLYLYFQSSCSSGLNPQPWYGPYPIPKSPELPYYVQQIVCNEQVSASVVANGPAWIKPGAVCFSSDSSLQERVFRFPSGVTGPVIVHCVSWFGPASVKKAAFYYKSASKPLDEFNWQYLGCWSVNGTVADTLPLVIPMEQDTAYYLLLDYNINNGGFRFATLGCDVVCPGVDTVFTQMVGNDSLLLSWPSAGAALRYQVRFQVDGQSGPVEWMNYPDTFLLVPNVPAPWWHDISIRTVCSGGFYSPWRVRRYLTGKHPVYQESMFSYDCNPRFRRPFGGVSGGYPYEVTRLRVPQTGDYFVKSRTGLFDTPGSALAVYRNAFIPSKPLDSLLAFAANKAGAPYDPDRCDTLLHLEAAQDYYLVSTRMEPNEPFFAGQFVNLWIDGPLPAVLEAPVFQTKDSGAHGLVPDFTGELQPDFTCVDTTGWRHFYRYGNNPYDRSQDYILLSIQDYPQLDYNASFGQLILYDLAGASRITNPPANYLQNTSGWFVMNRFWNTKDYVQPSTPIKVRNYFTESDFTQLRDSVQGHGGALDMYQQLIFYKINGIHNPDVLDPFNSHPGVPAAQAFDTPLGYWEYTNGAGAGPTTWRYGTHGNAHYAEILIRWLSGGGGGRTVNGQGALVPTVSTNNPYSKSRLSVHPNPFQDRIWVNSQDGSSIEIVELWDFTGHLVASASGPAEQMSLFVKALPAGGYTLRVTTQGTVFSYLVIKV